MLWLTDHLEAVDADDGCESVEAVFYQQPWSSCHCYEGVSYKATFEIKDCLTWSCFKSKFASEQVSFEVLSPQNM